MDRNLLAESLRRCESQTEPGCFASGKELLRAVEDNLPYDAVFLDIYMPGESGVEIAGNLYTLSPSTGIVFVTTSLDFAVDAFSLIVSFAQPEK